MRPGGGQGLQKGLSLGGALQGEFGRWAQDSSPFDRCGEGLMIVRPGGTVGVGEEPTLNCTQAISEHRLQPIPQILSITDEIRFDGIFEPARIGKGADREGGREPGREADDI